MWTAGLTAVHKRDAMVVCGVIGLPKVPTDDPTVQGEESATITADEAASVTAGEFMTTPLVHHARETNEETDIDTEAGNLTPRPEMNESRPHRVAAYKPNPHTLDCNSEEEGDMTDPDRPAITEAAAGVKMAAQACGMT
ncbi:hypothetical protein NDU88_005979 [Pleurodeles waltl]|uniref:Uncharacterized protein n=1 Tax=Pleurodeles waltl TaxID=8319 RepID=A0AAV7VPI4_PLEWA|nr:hypothetical protein NDU88_005979 [Pleurodeles waltl]